MRPLTEILDVDAMPWEPLGPPGLFSKMLNRDPETGARTALQRMDPTQGYTPPTIAHHHHTYEELLVIKGYFSFDAKRWAKPLSYIFHPPHCVHGFKSTVPEESWFVSRVEHDLDFNFIPEPTHDDIYPVNGTPPERSITALVEPLNERGAKPLLWAGGETPVEWCELSVHPQTGEGSALVRFPAGWSGKPADTLRQEYLEMFVLEGDLDIDGKTMRKHFYTFRPSGTFPKSLTSRDGALVYVNFGARAG
jgi:hypothetical protein